VIFTSAIRAAEHPMLFLSVSFLAAAVFVAGGTLANVQSVAAPLILAQANQPAQKQPSQPRPRGGMSERQLLQNPLVQQILRDPELQQQIMDDPRFRDMMQDPQMQRLMQNPQLQRQMQQNQQLREMYQLQRRPLPGVGGDDD
jgi:hypothetical protein